MCCDEGALLPIVPHAEGLSSKVHVLAHILPIVVVFQLVLEKIEVVIGTFSSNGHLHTVSSSRQIGIPLHFVKLPPWGEIKAKLNHFAQSF